jgi:hypothetical protein
MISFDDAWSRELQLDEGGGDFDDIPNSILAFMRLRESFEFQRAFRERYTPGAQLQPTTKERIAADLEQMRRGVQPPSSSSLPHTMPSTPRVNFDIQLMDEADEYESEGCLADNDENDFGMFRLTNVGGMNQNNHPSAPSKCVPTKPMWKQVWTRLQQSLRNQMTEDVHAYFANYNCILKLHVQHRISLDPLCFTCLTVSTEPANINSIFNLSLVSTHNASHIHCLYENYSIFHALLPILFNHESKEPSLLLFSLSVLLYKTVCYGNRRNLSESIMRKLVPFINRNIYPDSFKKVACKHFLKGKSVHI